MSVNNLNKNDVKIILIHPNITQFSHKGGIPSICLRQKSILLVIEYFFK